MTTRRNQRSRPAMMERMRRFISDCPRAGSEFPDFSARLLDGGDVRLADLEGRAVVLETGSFT